MVFGKNETLKGTLKTAQSIKKTRLSGQTQERYKIKIETDT